jgi:hypothetical protein
MVSTYLLMEGGRRPPSLGVGLGAGWDGMLARAVDAVALVALTIVLGMRSR